MQFNKQQQKAIEHFKNPCAVIAGAGSGKTTVIHNRIKYLIENHNVNPKDILVISFTRNTANQLQKKLNKMKYSQVKVGTFNAICQGILRENGVNISKKILEWQIENCFKKIDEKADIKDIMSFISYQKNYLKTWSNDFEDKESDYTYEELRMFFKEYESFKNKNGLYDFEDDLIECYKLLSSNKNHHYSYEYVLVDEHQDSNLVQNLLLKEICKSGNIMAVFDYRQAIYTFRGGNPEYCMNFNKDWDNAIIINLDTNYRSSENIVSNANNFIKKYYGDYEYYSDSISNNKNNSNVDINTYSCKQEEGKEIVDEIERLIKDGDKLDDIAVLYRLNSHSSYVENELKQRKIPYYIENDSSFFKRTEINLIMSYLRLVDNPHDNGALDNILKSRNYPFKFFSKVTIENIKENAARKNVSLYESLISLRYSQKWETQNAKIFENNINGLKLQKDKKISIEKIIDNVKVLFKIEEFLDFKYTNIDECKERTESIETLKTFIKGNNLENFITYVYSGNDNKKKEDNCVKLMSIHASKGLEFKNVFIISIEDGKFPHDKSPLLDEARLFYVGVTRPKENLYLSQIGQGNQFIEEYMSNINLNNRREVV
jgi:DNA helicase-2/ATP-dependent DNA helicase PcrA